MEQQEEYILDFDPAGSGYLYDEEGSVNLFELDSKMLDYQRRLAFLEQYRKDLALDEIEAEIKEAVIKLGATRTAGNLRATYNSGRKTFDWETATANAPEHLFRQYTKLVTDYTGLGRAMIETGLMAESDVPYTKAQPSVTFKTMK